MTEARWVTIIIPIAVCFIAAYATMAVAKRVDDAQNLRSTSARISACVFKYCGYCEDIVVALQNHINVLMPTGVAGVIPGLNPGIQPWNHNSSIALNVL